MALGEVRDHTNNPAYPSLVVSNQALPHRRVISLEKAWLHQPGTVPEGGMQAGGGEAAGMFSWLCSVRASRPRGGPLDIKGSFCPLPSGRAVWPAAADDSGPVLTSLALASGGWLLQPGSWPGGGTHNLYSSHSGDRNPPFFSLLKKFFFPLVSTF